MEEIKQKIEEGGGDMQNRSVETGQHAKKKKEKRKQKMKTAEQRCRETKGV